MIAQAVRPNVEAALEGLQAAALADASDDYVDGAGDAAELCLTLMGRTPADLADPAAGQRWAEGVAALCDGADRRSADYRDGVVRTLDGFVELCRALRQPAPGVLLGDDNRREAARS
jgi:hypothetical protein